MLATAVEVLLHHQRACWPQKKLVLVQMSVGSTLTMKKVLGTNSVAVRSPMV